MRALCQRAPADACCIERPMNCDEVILALGGNLTGRWGSPADAMTQAIDELGRHGVHVIGRSGVYRSAALGGGRQPAFLNAVILVRSTLPPAGLLRLLKRLERAAGRRAGRRWGPRPLDLDIIDFRGARLCWSARPGRRSSLTLPHPEAHKRRFVLQPLLDVAPHWRHPGFGVPGRQLLSKIATRPGHVTRIPPSRRGAA